MEGLLEGDLDLESQAIDADDIQGGQGQVRAHQQDGTAKGMEYHDEADEDADGTPQQVGGPEAEDHVLLAIDGAGCLLELVGIFQEGCGLDLLPVLCRSALGPWPVRRRGMAGRGGDEPSGSRVDVDVRRGDELALQAATEEGVERGEDARGR